MSGTVASGDHTAGRFLQHSLPVERIDLMAWTSLCNLDELEDGQGKYVEIDGFQLAVFLDNGAVSVIDNTCPHAGGNLAAGYVDDGCAVCPWHYWAFRLDNGQMRDSPGVAVTKYAVRVFEHQGNRLVQAELPLY